MPLRRPDDEILCIIALVDSQDRAEKTPEIAAAAESNESQELHEQLQRFRQQTALRYRIERVVGVTPAMRRARAQAEVAAATRASVAAAGTAGQRPPPFGRGDSLRAARPNRAVRSCRWNAGSWTSN